MVHFTNGGFWSPFPARKKSRCWGDGICGTNGVAGGAAVNEGICKNPGMFILVIANIPWLNIMNYLVCRRCDRFLCFLGVFWRLFKICCFFHHESGGWWGHEKTSSPKFIRSFRFDLLTADRTSHRHSIIKGMMVSWSQRVFSKNLVYPEKDDLHGFLEVTPVPFITPKFMLCLNMFRALSIYKDTRKDLVQSKSVRNSAMWVALCEASMMLGFEVALLANRAEARLRLQCLVTNFVGNRQTLAPLLGFDI